MPLLNKDDIDNNRIDFSKLQPVAEFDNEKFLECKKLGIKYTPTLIERKNLEENEN